MVIPCYDDNENYVSFMNNYVSVSFCQKQVQMTENIFSVRPVTQPDRYMPATESSMLIYYLQKPKKILNKVW